MSAPLPATPFQATLLPASFRGVPFIVEENEDEFGQRGQLHQYPKRNMPWAEPLGRRARKWQFRAFVLGDDCADQAAALRAAVEQTGPGLLIHPSIGMLMAQPDPERPSRGRETLTEGRKVTFELAFVEAGQVLYPSSASDTQASSQSAANNIDSAANTDLANNVSQVASDNTDIAVVQTAASVTDLNSVSGLGGPTTTGQAPIINDPGVFQP